MKVQLLLIASVWLLAVAAFALAANISAAFVVNPVPYFVAPIVVTGAALSYGFRRRREQADRTANEDSVEKEIAVHVRSAVMIDSLIIGCAVGLLLLIGRSTAAAPGAFLIVGLIVLDFYIRYSVALRRLRADR